MVIEKCPMNTELKLVIHSQGHPGFSISTVWKPTPMRRAGWLGCLSPQVCFTASVQGSACGL